MDRLFLDVNILFSAVWSPSSGRRRLWLQERARSHELVTSSYAIEEARRNLETPKQRAELDKLLKQVDEVVPPPATNTLPASIILPEKDRPILLAVISAGATHLLTGDLTHFGRYYGKTIKRVLIIPPGDYV